MRVQISLDCGLQVCGVRDGLGSSAQLQRVRAGLHRRQLRHPSVPPDSGLLRSRHRGQRRSRDDLPVHMCASVDRSHVCDVPGGSRLRNELFAVPAAARAFPRVPSALHRRELQRAGGVVVWQRARLHVQLQQFIRRHSLRDLPVEFPGTALRCVRTSVREVPAVLSALHERGKLQRARVDDQRQHSRRVQLQLQRAVEGRGVPVLHRQLRRGLRPLRPRLRALPAVLPHMHDRSRLQRRTRHQRDGQLRHWVRVPMRWQLDGPVVRELREQVRPSDPQRMRGWIRNVPLVLSLVHGGHELLRAGVDGVGQLRPQRMLVPVLRAVERRDLRQLRGAIQRDSRPDKHQLAGLRPLHQWLRRLPDVSEDLHCRRRLQ